MVIVAVRKLYFTIVHRKVCSFRQTEKTNMNTIKT